MEKKTLDCLKVLNFIETSPLFVTHQIRNKKILISFSGGQDSSCLLTLFYILHKKWTFQLGLVYCNHGWKKSTQRNFKIFQTLKNWNLPFYWVEAPNSTPVTPEQKARNWRYSALSRVSRFGAYDFVLTGHSLSDYSETVLVNLIRGSGLKGFQSFKEFQTLNSVMAQETFLVQTNAYFQTSWEDFQNQRQGFQSTNPTSSLVSFFPPTYPTTCLSLSSTVQRLILKKQTEQLSPPVLKIDHVDFESFLNLATVLNSPSQEFASVFKVENPKTEANSFLTASRLSFQQRLNHEFPKINSTNETKLRVWRPLLKLNRETLFLLSQQLHLSIFYDSSNKDLTLTRNYIRKLVMPLLKQLNPCVEENIYRFSHILKFYYERYGDIPCPPNHLKIFRP